MILQLNDRIGVARILEGDVILSIDGRPVGNDGSVADGDGRIPFGLLVDRKQIGDSVSIRVLRDGVRLFNTNGDDDVNITDPVSLLNFLFSDGSAPAAPYPDCGPGMLPADPELGCANPPACQ